MHEHKISIAVVILLFFLLANVDSVPQKFYYEICTKGTGESTETHDLKGLQESKTLSERKRDSSENKNYNDNQKKSFDTLDLALQEFARSYTNQTSGAEIILNCTCNEVATHAEYTTFFRSVKYKLAYSIHDCKLANAHSWQVKEIPIAFEGLGERILDLAAPSEPSLSHEHKKYGKYRNQVTIPPTEGQKLDSVTKERQQQHHPSKSAMEISFSGVSFLGADHTLFGMHLKGVDVCFYDCKISNYSGEGFLRMTRNSYPSSLKAVRNQFTKVKGYALYAKGLHGYEVSNNLFSDCALDSNDTACVHLHMDYISGSNRDTLMAKFEKNIFQTTSNYEPLSFHPGTVGVRLVHINEASKRDSVSIVDNQIPDRIYDISIVLEDAAALWNLYTLPLFDIDKQRYPITFEESEGMNSLRTISRDNPSISGRIYYRYGPHRSEECKLETCKYDYELEGDNYCTVAASRSSFANYYDIQTAVDQCPYSMVVLLGGIYTDTGRKPLSISREGMFLLSFKQAVIMGMGHTLRANHITIRGITFESAPAMVVNVNDRILLTLDGTDLSGISIKNNIFTLSADVESALRMTGNTSALNFSYNMIFTANDPTSLGPKYSFHDSVIFATGCVDGLIFDGNKITAAHIGPKGAMSFMCLTGKSSFKDNFLQMYSYEGVSPSVHLRAEKESQVIFSSNTHTCSNKDSWMDLDRCRGSQAAFKLEGISPNDVWGNSVLDADNGLHYLGDEKIKDLKKNNPLINVYSITHSPISNVGLGSSLVDDIQESYVIDPPDKCIVDRENALGYKTLGYEYFSTLDSAIMHCSSYASSTLTEEDIANVEIRDLGPTEMYHFGGSGVKNLLVNGMGTAIIFSMRTFEISSETVSLEFRNLEIHSKSPFKGSSLFRCDPTDGCKALKRLVFENVHFFGDQSQSDFIHLSGVPENAIVIVKSCSFNGWDSTIGENGNGIYLKQSQIGAPSSSLGVSGMIFITENTFHSIDGYSIRLETLYSNANISANEFVNCGGRNRGSSAMLSVSHMEGASVWIMDNESNQRLPILYPTSGSVSHPHWFSTYWVDIQGIPNVWKFQRNSCYGHPIGARFPGSMQIANQVFPMSFLEEEQSSRLDILDVVSDFVQRSGNCDITGYYNDLILSDPRQDGSSEGLTRSCSSGTSVGNLFGDEPLDFSSPVKIYPTDSGEEKSQGNSCKCFISPPTRCIVSKSVSKKNPFYGKWLFNTVSEALVNCISASRKIEVQNSFPQLAYQERIYFNGGLGTGWTLYSLDGATLQGFGHTFFADNTTISGIIFSHYGEGPIISSPISHPLVSGLKFINCEFRGDYGHIQAIKGKWNRLSFESVSFTNTGEYKSNSGDKNVIGRIIEVVDTARFTMRNCSFFGTPNGAVDLQQSESYSFLGNRFCAHPDDLSRNYTGIHLVTHSSGNVSEFHGNSFSSCHTYSNNDNDNGTNLITEKQEAERGHVLFPLENVTTAFWLESDSEEKESLPAIFSNNQAYGTHVGMRITRASFDHWTDRNSQDYHKSLSDHVNFNNNTGLQGIWHDIVTTPPEYDSELQRVPIQNLENICDGGCETADYTGIGALIVFIFIFCCLLCCCICWGANREPPRVMQSLWSNYLQRFFPRNRKFWPLISYGYLPWQTWNHQARPVPAYFADNEAAQTALDNEKNYPGSPLNIANRDMMSSAAAIGSDIKNSQFNFAPDHSKSLLV